MKYRYITYYQYDLPLISLLKFIIAVQGLITVGNWLWDIGNISIRVLYKIKMADSKWLECKQLEEIDDLPSYGFRLGFSHQFTEKCGPFMMPRLHQIPGFLGMSLRYTWTWFQKKKEGKKLFIDNLNLLPWKPIYGAPIGGIGGGTIGRGFRGEFCRFQMVPGMYQHNVVHEDQFILTVRQEGKTIYQRVLSVYQNAPSASLSSWQWGFPEQNATYHALYPRAWYVYDVKEVGVKLVCRQVSPVLPHDYKDSSLPCAAFVWSIENKTTSPLEVSITFTFCSGQGGNSDDHEPGAWSEGFEHRTGATRATGATIHQTFRGIPCSYNIAANERTGVDVSSRVGFDPTNEDVVADVWRDLQEDGMLDVTPPACTQNARTARGEKLACAVCAQCDVLPNSKNTLEFALAWNMPTIEFGSHGQQYSRRYTRFFPPHHARGAELAAYTLDTYTEWESKIEAWQKPTLENSALPSWYKSALFNELYYVSDGGTVWVEDPDISHPHTAPVPGAGKKRKRQAKDVPKLIQEYGKFAYLEGHEYRMYNTYDVHHYASFALIMLWPKLQLSLQYDIGAAIPEEQGAMVRYCMNGEWDVTKAANCVPHDIGDPDDDPWLKLNAYVIHPTHEWKDLNTKFILQLYRDYTLTKNEEYLKDLYPHAKTVMDHSLRWDTDGDGIIDNAGFADQTYDAWSVTGASAYCGGMWLAAVKMFCEMAKLLQQEEDLAKFSAILDKAKTSFETKLWNGRYYNYDSSKSEHHNSIMSDQLAGHWYLKAAGVTDEVFPEEHVHSTLDTVFNFNVLPFDGGKMGAINGMRPDGCMDDTSPQSEEFWTGVTYALAATMVQEGHMEQAWQTAYGAYHTCYERYGLAFQTPEAYFCDQRFRSLGYMRPLAIWAIQHALEMYQPTIVPSGKLVEDGGDGQEMRSTKQAKRKKSHSKLT